MDNPNDFIHIDEVFRKLKDKEEPEGNGSWMRMKELLDNEMPVGSPASPVSTLRRYMIPMIAALLIGSGLAYYGIHNNNDLRTPGHEHNGVIVSDNSNAKTHSLPGANTGGHQSAPEKAGTAMNNAPVDKDQSKAGIKDNAGKNAAGLASSANRYNTDHYSNSNSKTVAGSLQKPANNNDKTQNAIAGSSDNNRPKKSTTGSENKVHGNKPLTSAVNGKATIAPPSKPFEEQNIIETIYPVANGTKTNVVNNVNTAANPGNTEMQVVAAHYNEDKIVKDENGSFFKEVRDTVKKIDMVQRAAKDVRGNKTTEIVVDTLAITRVERIRYTPLAPMEIAALRKASIIPQAKAVVPMARMKTVIVSNETVNMVPLSDYKVASRRVDPSKFNQLIQNTSQGISNYFDGTNKFYAALFLGANGFMGNPSAFGMQFGIAGLYQLNERLTLMAELKYANHYFSNYSINDQSVTYDNVSGQQSGLDWLFSGTQNTTTSSYKINNFSALEFPVTLNYSLGRISVSAGLNMAYAFPLKWDKGNVLNTTTVSQQTSKNQNPFLNSNFKLQEQNDFGSRFGMGYVAGVSYDLSRKLSFDARVTQNVWTNYNGDADAVNKLFKMPTFQFSIGYFFGRKEKVVFIMDK